MRERKRERTCVKESGCLYESGRVHVRERERERGKEREEKREKGRRTITANSYRLNPVFTKIIITPLIETPQQTELTYKTNDAAATTS